MKRISPGQIQAELERARIFYENGNAGEAISRLDYILSTNPDSLPALAAKASYLIALTRLPEALKVLSQHLRYDPSDITSLRLSTQLSLKIGLADQAEKFALKLTRLDPRDDRAFFILSISQSLGGRWLDALASINKAETLKPQELDYIVGKAQLLVKLRMHQEAIRYYRAAIEMHPHIQFAVELAEVLLEESQTSEALALIQEFALPLPENSRPNLLIATVLTESQKHQEADAYWKIAQQGFGDSSDFVEKRARSEISAGRLQIAEELLRSELERSSSSASLFSLLTMIVKVKRNDADLVESMESILGKLRKTSPIAAQSLNFALGKSYQDLGDYGKAMSFFDEANRLREEVSPNNVRFNRGYWQSYIEQQIAFFTEERISSLFKGGFDSSRPLFIMGMIRSGTTLCEHVLSCHTQIKDFGESSFWIDRRWEVMSPELGKFQSDVARRLGGEYLGILKARSPSATYVSDKNPLNVLFACALHCIYPNAKMIHMKRHPVDNLLSIWTTPISTGLQFISTKEDLVFAYRQYTRLAEHLTRVLPPDKFRTFSYEDLTSQPETVIGEIMEYLDLPLEAGCLAPQNNSRTVKTPSVFQVRQPINTASQGRWQPYKEWLGPFAELLNDSS